jgi:hypothetical protein
LSDRILQCSSVWVVPTAIAVAFTLTIGSIPLWFMPVATIRRLATDVALLYYWGRGYMRKW